MSHHTGFGGPFNDLPTGLWTSAHWVWDRRAAAKKLGFPFSEESVTETILLDLAATLGHIIKIVPFTKPEEGKIGADWEWCLYDNENGRYLRFLMQAKVLDNQDTQYAHIDRYIGNSGVQQIARLAEVSSQRGAPALYAFYNNLNDPAAVPLANCACHACRPCWGVSVAPLDAVRAALPDKTFATLKVVSMPWLCLLCTASGSGPSGDPINGALQGLRRLKQRSIDLFPDADRGDRPPLRDEPETEPPPYLNQVLSAFPDEDGGSEIEWERRNEKLARENPDLDGLVVIDAKAAMMSDVERRPR